MIRVPLRPAPVLALVALLACAASARGYSGFVISLPDARGRTPVASVNGLRLTLDCRWTERAGYLPVKVRLDATASSTKDREVELTFAAFTRGDDDLKVPRVFTIPAGETVVEGELLVPITEPWRFYWWETRVNGVPDRALSIQRETPQSTNAQAGRSLDNGALAVLTPSAGAGGWRRTGRSGSIREYAALGGEAFQESRCEAQPGWLGYTASDVVRLGLAEVESLAKEPVEFTALRRWVAAGGTLWVEGVGERDDGLGDLADVLDGAGWTFGVGSKFGDQPIEGRSGWRHESLAPPLDKDKVVATEQTDNVDIRLGDVAAMFVGKNSRGWYAVHDFGFGRVVAFTGAATSPPRSLGREDRQQAAERWRERGWASRHGLAPPAASTQFGNLLIPGVGTAPVGEFQVLITLFVIGIGPLNYWLLRRAQRLHLLVLTTPLAAAAVTLGLVVYALVGDGFGVKARVRSVTLLNQTAAGGAEAASWSRVSHYASSAPGEPLSFDDQTAVYPIRPAWESAIAQRGGGPRVVDWAGGRQTLERGWLPTRTATQHLVVRSGATDRGMKFSPADSPRECLNELGVEIEWLLVRPVDDAWLYAEAVGAGEAAALAPIERLEAVSELRNRLLDNEPEFPLGAGQAAEETIEKLQLGPRVRRSLRDFGRKTLGDNLMNKTLDRLVGLEGSKPLSLPPKTYVAVTSESVETPLGFERSSIREIGSFHVVLGRW